MNDIGVQVFESDKIGKRVVVAHRDGEELHRDCFNSDEAAARNRFANTVAEKLGVERECLDYLDSQILTEAERRDEMALAQLDGNQASRIGQPKVLTLSDVTPTEVEWLWPGRIALGKLTLIAGDPGLGKSFLTLDMAARVSRGYPWPDQRSTPGVAGSVVLLSAEDDAADTIRPRLDAAEADCKRIALLEAVETYDSESKRLVERTFSLERDLTALESAIESMKDCRLVIIDPITAYLGKTDSHRNSDIRSLLAPLGDMASRHRVAVVAVTHLNKSSGGPAIYRAMGSLAFVAAARAAWAVVADRQNPSRRMLLPVKNNIGPDQSGLAFSLVNSMVNGGAGQPVVGWEPDPVNIRVDDALSVDADGQNGAVAEAVEWLAEALSDGRLPSKDIQRMAKGAGHSWATVRRAKEVLDVRVSKHGFQKDAGWTWELPSAEDVQSPTPETLSTFAETEHLRENPEENGTLFDG